MSSRPDPRLNLPVTAVVELDPGRRPRSVGGAAVESIREEWVVEDRWWTPSPLRRHYFEVVLAGGRCVVVFRDLCERSWWSQRT